MSRRFGSSLVIALLLLGSGARLVRANNKNPEVSQVELLHQLRLLNQVPETQLDEKVDPAFAIIRGIYDSDGPDFLTLRKLMAEASIRSTLNPSAKSVLAGILSTRWDSFALSGNLWLASLGSPNESIRMKARKKLVQFIQPAHIPALIEMLGMPGANVQVYQVLVEVTGQPIKPDIRLWRQWWAKNQKSVDIVGHLLKDTKEKLITHPIAPIDHEKFWYLPEGLSDARTPYTERKEKEQHVVTLWNAWANQDVRRYVDAWRQAKSILDRITHQPDPRVNDFLRRLSQNPGYGDYTSVVLAWRANATALPDLQAMYKAYPSVSRALARGSLGDKSALVDLLHWIEKSPRPFTFSIMDDDARASMDVLRTVGVIPAEQAFELLAHQVFDFDGASTKSEKKRALQKARRWLEDNYDHLLFDRRRGYFLSERASR